MDWITKYVNGGITKLVIGLLILGVGSLFWRGVLNHVRDVSESKAEVILLKSEISQLQGTVEEIRDMILLYMEERPHSPKGYTRNPTTRSPRGQNNQPRSERKETPRTHTPYEF